MITLFTTRKMISVEYVSYIGEIKNAYKILTIKYVQKRLIRKDVAAVQKIILKQILNK
jgi:hypothetical protein